MIEAIIALLALVVLIMFSGLVKRGIVALGNGVGSIGGAASHLVEAGADQSKRARIVSLDSLEDTKLDYLGRSAERESKRASFLEGLSADQKKRIGTSMQFIDSL